MAELRLQPHKEKLTLWDTHTPAYSKPSGGLRNPAAIPLKKLGGSVVRLSGGTKGIWVSERGNEGQAIRSPLNSPAAAAAFAAIGKASDSNTVIQPLRYFSSLRPLLFASS